MSGRTGPFRRSDRLLRSREFQHVARHGRRAVVRGFVVLVAPRAADKPEARPRPGSGVGPRLGITVSKRVGNSVLRNRVKRRIREWFRGERSQLDGGFDLVVIARSAAAPLLGREISEQLGHAVRELGVSRA